MAREREDGWDVYRTVRRQGPESPGLEVRYRVGQTRGTAEPGSLDEFLIERYVLHVVRRDPRLFGEERSRWTLAAIQRAVAWMAELQSVAGVWRMLGRLGVHWKLGQDHLVSPDPAYAAKLVYLQEIRAAVLHDPDRQILVFQDEMTYYRQPTLAAGYDLAGTARPRAERSYRANTPTRVAAALAAGLIVETGTTLRQAVTPDHLLGRASAVIDFFG